MNKVKSFYIILFLLNGMAIYGQDFTGTIKNLDSNKPVTGVKIDIFDLHNQFISDSNGIFIVSNFPKTKINFQLSKKGYETLIQEVDLTTTLDLTFLIEMSHFDLQEVIISAPNGKLQNENITPIDRREIALLNQSATVTLAEALTNIPGVEQRSTGAGIGKPVIRGLSGNRIVTYAQGIRLENQQWGDEHGLGVGSVGIESVEVIKGPASLLYGSDALGGVLYFVDTKYAGLNKTKGFIESNFQSNTLGTQNNLGLKINRNNIKWNVFASMNSSTDYQIPDGQRVFNSRFSEQNIKSSLGYSKGKWVTNLRYSYLKNNFGITEEDSSYSNSTERNFSIPFQEINNQIISWENILFVGQTKFQLVTGYTGNRRKEFEDNDKIPALDLDLQTLTYNLKWKRPFINDNLQLIIGSQGMYQNNINYGEELLIPDATTKDIGFFGVVNYDIKNVSIQGGFRSDYRQIHSQKEQEMEILLFPDLVKDYSSTNYSLGASYVLNKIILRSNISSGFRSPNTSELLSNGVHEGTNQYVRGNSELLKENATQIDFSVSSTSEHFDLSINPFYNIINNYIFLSPQDEMIDGSPVFDYEQTDAMLYGGELSLHYHPHNIHWLHLSSDISTVFGEDGNKNDLPLIPATRVNSMFKVEIASEKKLKITNLFISHTYKFDQNHIGQFESNTRSYQLFNMGGTFEMKTKDQPIQLNLGIKNIFNIKYIDHLSRLKTYNIPNQGINFYAGLSWNFNMAKYITD